jgi:hypothetical protein
MATQKLTTTEEQLTFINNNLCNMRESLFSMSINHYGSLDKQVKSVESISQSIESIATNSVHGMTTDAMASLAKACNDYFWRGGFYQIVTAKKERISINRKDVQFVREFFSETVNFDGNGTPDEMPERIVIFFSNSSEPIEFSTVKGHENEVSDIKLDLLMLGLTGNIESFDKNNVEPDYD